MFTHLHVHTEYSLLDGMCRIQSLVQKAKELGMKSLAITDHGAMYGVIQFYLAAREAGIKPIIGCEVYVAQGDRFSRNPSDKSNNHLILLAKNDTGYKNLIHLVTKAHLEGFYYRPKVDKELLKQYNEGLIALSACISGEVPNLVLNGRLNEAKQAAQWYKETFKDYYLEIQRHPMPELVQINAGLMEIGNELSIPFVATNDVHYINREDAPYHDILMCIGTNSTVQDPNRKKMSGDFFYLKTPEEMAELYKDLPQAIENTERIADMCNLQLEFGRLHLPEIDRPAGKSPDEYLADLCAAGLESHYPNPSEEIKKRLAYELDVIKKTQFANYFLVVWDIISFVRRNNILFGVRGSAAASIVLHCLGITEVEPIGSGLVFERFLNIERREMPDIDMDFQDDRREEVIRYVSDKYGTDHVAQIITFGTLGARAAVRDVGRALGMTYAFVDRVARLIPFAVNMTLSRAMEENQELRDLYAADQAVRNLIDSAKKLEGISRHSSTHAAGVVISKAPLTEHIPLQKATRGDDENLVMTQFGMDDIAKIGLLKMDFLGLVNLTILGRAQEIIQRTRNKKIDLHRIPLNDKKTFALLASGETTGVFQLEGSGMRRYIRELKPTVFSDIAAMVALYRPGPMEHIPTFIKSKHGEEPIRYPHPALKDILEETYGVIVYQDQVLFIVRTFAGYSLGQADIFRKAMGKKIPEVMQKEKANFIAGAIKNSFSEEVAASVFALIEPFAGYAFNKAHSFSYALIAYQTAFFKANYPAEYMTALLTSYADVPEKVASAVADCRRLGIPVLKPDVNHSDLDFAVENQGSKQVIRFGLAAIKNVGAAAVTPLVAERKKSGPFKSVEELCRRCDLRGVNKRVLESLIKAGAMDELGKRGALLQNLNSILALAQREQQLKETGQITMFDMLGEKMPVPMPGLEIPGEDALLKEKLAWEKELLGVFLSEHPFSAFASSSSAETTLCSEIDQELVGQSVKVAGMVSAVTSLVTRDRQPFVSITLEDLSGSIEVMVWPRIYRDTKELWAEGNMLLVEGKVKEREERMQLYCDKVDVYKQPEAAPEKPKPAPKPVQKAITKLIITINQTDDEQKDLGALSKIVNINHDFPGDDPVILRVINGEKIYNLKMAGAYYCPELHKRLAAVVGEEGLRVETNGKQV